MAEIMYDHAHWHHGELGGLPNEAAATHIGMFAFWMWLNGFASDEAAKDYADDIEAVRSRKATPGVTLDWLTNGALDEDDLNDEGNAFASAYYLKDEEVRIDPGSYIHDYLLAFADCPSIYAVPDSWDSFDKISPVIAVRLREWRVTRFRS